MWVSGLATMTVPPATLPCPVMASFSCVLTAMRNLSAKASTIVHPMLCRLRAYSGPGLPRPMISFTRGRVAESCRLSVVGCPRPPDNRSPTTLYRTGQKHALMHRQSMTDQERIVVIDDSANDLAVIRRVLERKGYLVKTATSGED